MQSHIHRPSQASFMATAPMSSRKGFTLIELLVVVTIIGILVSVILVASYDGVRTANLKATQALVLKLDLAVKERIQALLDDDVYPNGTHMWLATPSANKVGNVGFGPSRGLAPGRGGKARAKATLHIEDLADELGIEISEEDFEDVDTIGGLMAQKLGRVPIAGSTITVGQYLITSERPIGRRRRISSVLIEKESAGNDNL